MIEEHARVLEIKDQQAIIQVQRQSACHSCSLEQGCGTGSLGRLLGRKELTFTLHNRHHLKPGDHIVIGLSEDAYLKAGFLIYLLPLITLFLFAAVADVLFSLEWANVLAAVIGLVFGLWIAARLSGKRYLDEFQARFIRREFI